MAQNELSYILKLKDEASKTLQGFNSNLKKSQGSVVNFATNTIKSIAKVGTVLGGMVGTGLLYGSKVAGDLEAAESGFKALLGSAEEAGAVMERIKKEAATTPFEIQGLTQGTQALTAIYKDGDKAIDTLLSVGKAVSLSGKGQAELDRVVLNLQQVSSTGKMTEMDLRQFRSAIPIFDDILASVGLTAQSLKDLDDPAESIRQAFVKAGEEGGITFDGFASQSGNFNQILSNLKDTFTITMEAIAKETGVFDFLKQAMKSVGDWVIENKEQIINFLKTFGEVVKVTVGAGILVFNALKEAAIFLYETFQLMWGFIKPIFDAMYAEFMKFWTEIEPEFNQAMQNLKEVWDAIFKAMQPVIEYFFVAIKITFDNIVAYFKIVWEMIKVIFKIALNGIITLVNTVMALMKGDISGALEAIKSGWITQWNAVKDYFSNVWQIISDTAKKHIDTIIGWINGLIDKFNSISSKVGISIPNIPNFSTGGFMGSDGMANLHRGEFVLSKNMLRGNQAIPSEIREKVSETNQNINVNAVINTPIDAVSLGNLLGQQLQFAGR